MKITTESFNENPIKNRPTTSDVYVENQNNNISNNKTGFEKSNLVISEMTDENGQPTKQAYQTAVNKMNEFMEYNQRNSKFIYHEELDKYYVEVVDAKTQEVIKEIPPKELLDAYYEMQKLAGKIFDTQA